MSKKKLMILGDNPNGTTGFGRVVRNLLSLWIDSGEFAEIHVWAIGYTGMPHDWPKHVRIYPASGMMSPEWSTVDNLKRFVTVIEGAEITHLFMVQDVWGLLPLSPSIRMLRLKKGLRAFLYFPCDAPFRPEWIEIALSVTEAVAYCNYGYEQAAIAALTLRARPAAALPANFDRTVLDAVPTFDSHLHVIPHGVDQVFRESVPFTKPRSAVRKHLLGATLAEDTFLMVNVSANQRRKGLVQSLQIFAQLRAEAKRKLDGEPKGAAMLADVALYLHCPAVNALDGTDLRLIAEQLGLGAEIGRRLFFGDRWFVHGKAAANDQDLVSLYHCADLLLSTSYGEGWGLPVTEAMACGLPVAVPQHTSLSELLDNRIPGGGSGMTERGMLFNTHWQEVMPHDNSRLRPRVSPPDCAYTLRHFPRESYATRAENAQHWIREDRFRWDNIAVQWLELMLEGKAPEPFITHRED